MGVLKRMRETWVYSRAFKRLDRVGSGVVQDWAHQCLWATQQGLDGFRNTQDEAALVEARRGILGLLAATDVLFDRLEKQPVDKPPGNVG